MCNNVTSAKKLPIYFIFFIIEKFFKNESNVAIYNKNKSKMFSGFPFSVIKFMTNSLILKSKSMDKNIKKIINLFNYSARIISGPFRHSQFNTAVDGTITFIYYK